jgi:hypothetical protein
MSSSHPHPHPEPAVRSNRGTKVIHALTICRPAHELYAALLDPAVQFLVIPSPGRLAWSTPTEFQFLSGETLVTTGQLINQTTNELLAWQTDPNGECPHAGTLRLTPAPADEGTEVTLQLEYEASLSVKFAQLFGREPGTHTKKAFRRFKALMEAGEIPTIEGQAAGDPQRKNRP